MATKKLTKAEKRSAILQQAHDGAKRLIDQLRELGARCMEQTVQQNEPGYYDWVCIWERWLLPNGTSVVVQATQDYREAFIQAAPRSNEWDDTLNAIKEAAAKP